MLSTSDLSGPTYHQERSRQGQSVASFHRCISDAKRALTNSELIILHYMYVPFPVDVPAHETS